MPSNLFLEILRWIRDRISILRIPTLLLLMLLFLSTGLSWAPAVFSGLLDIQTSDVWFVSWYALLAAYVAMVISRLIRMFAKQCLGVDTPQLAWRELRPRDLALWSLPAFPLVIEVVLRPGALTANDSADLPLRCCLAAVGLALAVFTLWFASLIQHLLGYPLDEDWKKAFDNGQKTYLLFSHKHPILSAARDVQVPALPVSLPSNLKSLIGRCYWRPQSGETPEHIREGYAVASALLLSTFAVYLGGFFSIMHSLMWAFAGACLLALVLLVACWRMIKAGDKFRRFVQFLLASIGLGIVVLIIVLFRLLESGSRFDTPLPPLAAVLLLLMVLAWGFGGLGFLLDAFRIPVLASALVLSVLINSFVPAEHRAPAEPMAHSEAFKEKPRPPDTVSPGSECLPCAKPTATAASNSTLPPLIAVSAAGGGIQAAAWTAKVLGELAKDSSINKQFGPSLRLISGVSGGSVGTLFFVDAYRDGIPPATDTKAAEVLTNAERSGLEFVGWGLVYPDFWRTLCPLCTKLTIDLPDKPTLDRAWALESSWKQSLTSPPATIHGWQRDAAANRRPVVILNATVAEEGLPLLLGPADLTPHSPTNDIYTMQTFFNDCDLAVQTAARLSATFPYVSPMAQAALWECPKAKNYHIADGGYFNNNGVFSLLRWLKDVVIPTAGVHCGQQLILVQIRSFADDPPPDKATFNWIEQTLGPAFVLNNVRGKGHNLTDRLAVSDFTKLAEAAGFKVTNVEFVFPKLPEDRKPPLSWHLTNRDIEIIAASWGNDDVKKNLCILRNALATPGLPATPCP